MTNQRNGKSGKSGKTVHSHAHAADPMHLAQAGHAVFRCHHRIARLEDHGR